MLKRNQSKLRMRTRRTAARRSPLVPAKRLFDFFFNPKNSISFKTKDEGRRIVISRHAFRNIYLERKEAKPRAMVPVLINGKKLFFYKSSGEYSHSKGEWFPTYGPRIAKQENGRPILGWMQKTEGHYQDFEKEFPEWCWEIKDKLKQIEGKLTFHPKWGIQEYKHFLNSLQHIETTYEMGLAAH